MKSNTPAPKPDKQLDGLFRENFAPGPIDPDRFDTRLGARIARSRRRRRTGAVGAMVLGAGLLIGIGSSGWLGKQPTIQTIVAESDSISIDTDTAFVLALDTFDEPDELTTYLPDEYRVLDLLLFGTL
ncbi:MAG: hypothetical protein CME06_06705 [Gemmatimonadetes bacterium]|nr:hypothetical protein [Gemmatimonadota bacterium]